MTTTLRAVCLALIFCSVAAFVPIAPTSAALGRLQSLSCLSSRHTCASNGGAAWSVGARSAAPAATGAAGGGVRAVRQGTMALHEQQGDGPEGDSGSSAAAASAAAAAAAKEEDMFSSFPALLNPSTRGGAVVVPILSILLPLAGYVVLTATGMDGLKAGNYVSFGYILLGLVTWTGTYMYRVATKNMTYAQQLRDYEDAVIENRFDQLTEEEVEALLLELEDEKKAEEDLA